MRKHLLWMTALSAALVTVGVFTPAGLAARKDEAKPDREILVPFEDLPELLVEKTRRVLLSRREYEELLEKARKAGVKHAPRNAVLISAAYTATLGDERARITGTLTVDVLEEGLHTVGLDLASVGLSSATLDGKGASLGLADDGRLMLFVEGKGHHRLVLEMVAPLRTTAARQILDFRLPTPAAAHMKLTVPGDVEVKSGAPVISRVWDEKAEETRIELLLRSGDTSLVMTLNSRLKRRDRVVVANSVMVDEFTEAYDRLHAAFSMSVLHRAVTEFRFAVPDGFDVTEVLSTKLARWAVSTEGARKVLEVYLREECTGTVLVNLSAVRMKPDLAAWRLPQFEPLDVAGHTAVVGLLLEERLKIEDVKTTGLISIDTSVLKHALPTTVLEAELGAARIGPVAAFYAPQAEFSLSARFPKPPAKVRVTTNLLLILEDGAHQLRGGFAILPEQEKVFSVDISVPAEWQVTSVTAQDGSDLRFERYETPGGAVRVHVRLPEGVPAGEEKRLYVHARHVPADWFAEWTETTATFPAVAVTGAARDVGAIAVDARDDMTVRPLELDRLTPLDENEKAAFGLGGVPANLAYRYEGQPYTARLSIERTRPRLTAQTTSFFRIERDSLVAHYELVYDVARARTRRLSLLLPKDTPAELKITGLDGLAIKEFTPETVGEMRRWTVLLAEPKAGELKLAVDFQQRRSSEQVTDWALPLVRADGVAYQSGLVSVEGSAELDVEITEHPRKVDVGELVDATYQPGPRLLGAFSFVGEAAPVKASVSRDPAYGLPPVIVERAELTTVLSADRQSQTAARFRLRTKTLFLEVMLPEGATLWSATLDGEPTKPQREDDRLLLNLPAGEEGKVRELLVVYEAPVRAIRLWSRLEVPAPHLFLHTSAGDDAVEIPVAHLVWHLHVPRGHRVVRSGGTVVTDQIVPPPLAVAEVTGGLYYLAGGVDTDQGLVTASLGRAVKYAAEPTVALFDSTVETAYEAEGHGVRDGTYINGRLRALHEKRKSLVDAIDAEKKKGDRYREADALERNLSLALKEVDRQIAVENEKLRPPGATVPLAAGEGGRTFALGAKPADRPPTVTTAPEPKPPAEAEPGRSGWRRDGATYYRLEGLRSLQIALEAAGPGITFTSLGTEPELAVTVTNLRRLGAFTWALALGVFLGGIVMTTRPVRRKVTYLLTVALVATLLPLITGHLELAYVFNGSFYAACLLVPYYLVAGLVRWIAGKSRVEAAAAATAVLMALTIVFGASTADAQERSGPYVINVVGPEKPVKVPEDAVILPYDPESRTGITAADKLLVPYDRFVKLWNRAYPERRIGTEKPPAPYALSGAVFRATLEGDEFLLLEGHVDIDVYTEDYATVPLPLEGGVLSKADLDGKPARLSVVSLDPWPSRRQNVSAALPRRSFVVLYVSGKGRHRLDLAVRLKLSRIGGWRAAEGRLPAAPATSLDLVVPDVLTEVRLGGVNDRRTYETKTPNQTIRTALGANGTVSIQWRPKVQEGQVDQTLTVDSDAWLDIREDKLRLSWSLSLKFRRGLREFFSIELPNGYLVEKVTGTNVRGWEVRGADGKQKLEVALLKPAKEHEEFEVRLWRGGAITGDEAVALEVPVIGVTGAIRHTGRVTIRRSPLLDVRTEETRGVTRTDLPTTQKYQDDSPLGQRPFEAYTFVRTPFSIRLSARPVTATTSATVQTLLRITERERKLESRVTVSVRRRPLHRVRVVVPGDFELDRVVAPGEFEWALIDENVGKVLTVYLAAGIHGEIPVIITGTLGKEQNLRVMDVPRIEVLDVERQEGDIAVQIDRAFNVQARDLKNIETVVLRRILHWLSSGQRPFVPLALHYKRPDYAGRLVVTPRKPAVTCDTFTNVRVTDRAVEETILLNFSIGMAGIREVSFLLPAWMKDARINVPLLRQKTIEPTGDPEVVRVKLELQDAIMRQLRVVIENDRLLSRQLHAVPMPVVETGTTRRRYVLLESAGRDEVILKDAEGLDPVGRQQEAWSLLKKLAGGGMTRAFIVKPDAEAPRLTFVTTERKLVETVEARISLSQTVLILDANGAYRAQMICKVNNSIEQFLEVALPEGASIWAARVAGSLVKPVQGADEDKPNHVRIPLVKTAEGDLDYDVMLKYGGKLPPLISLGRLSMPLIRTVNINTELSQVELHLPREFNWFAFGGTMSEAEEAGDIEAGVLSNWNKKARALFETARYSRNPFARARAEENVKTLAESVQSYVTEVLRDDLDTTYRSNTYFQKEVDASKVIVKQVREHMGKQAPAKTQPEVDMGNRARLNDEFRGQSNVRALHQVKSLQQNFTGDVRVLPDQQQQTLNPDWISSNELRVEQQVRIQTEGERAEAQKRDEDADKLRLSVEKRLQRRQTGAEVQQAYQPKAPDVAQKDVKGQVVLQQEQAAAQWAAQGPRGRSVADLTRRYQQKLEKRIAADKKAGVPTSFDARTDTIVRGGLMGEGGAGRMRDTSWRWSARMGVPEGKELAGAIAGLVSLDVELPQIESRVYRFTTPRGEVEITARAVSSDFIRGLPPLGIVVVAALVVFAIRLLMEHAAGITAQAGSILSWVLIILGVISLLFGIFWVLGVVALVVGIVWKIRRRRARRKAAAA